MKEIILKTSTPFNNKTFTTISYLTKELKLFK